jgi:large subunit ribosomal protein L18
VARGFSSAKARHARHARLRKKIGGTPERPRLCVRHSLHHIYAMLVDDTKGHTLAAASTLEESLSSSLQSRTNLAAAKAVGAAIAAKAKAAGIARVVFDRGGYRYHGRVRALADSAREAGLSF